MKYSVRFCHCGRIHTMTLDKYEWMEESLERRIIRVCQNCGDAKQTSLIKNHGGIDVCVSDVDDREFVGDNTLFVFSHGIRVPMKPYEGCDGPVFACHYGGGRWFHDRGRGEVDTEALINCIKIQYKDEADAILSSIVCYVCGINWKGTAYGKEY